MFSGLPWEVLHARVLRWVLEVLRVLRGLLWAFLKGPGLIFSESSWGSLKEGARRVGVREGDVMVEEEVAERETEHRRRRGRPWREEA